VPTPDERDAPDAVRDVRITTGGPMLVQGPVRIETADGVVVESDRFTVAVCTCRRSRTYPLCDTSHRKRRRSEHGSS
jgi:CDGSH-type Zn-finger protein